MRRIVLELYNFLTDGATKLYKIKYHFWFNLKLLEIYEGTDKFCWGWNEVWTNLTWRKSVNVLWLGLIPFLIDCIKDWWMGLLQAGSDGNFLFFSFSITPHVVAFMKHNGFGNNTTDCCRTWWKLHSFSRLSDVYQI